MVKGFSLQFVKPYNPPEPPPYKSIKEASDKKLAAEEAERLRLEALVSDCKARGGTLNAETCVLPPPAPTTLPTASTGVSEVSTSSEGLVGSLGYALPYGNCVDEPGVNNPGWGNPIDWPIISSSPWVGASALFWYNHVAVVTGIWSNGDIEVRHQNCPRCATRFAMSLVRGFR